MKSTEFPILHVLSYCNEGDLCVTALVNHSWLEMSRDDDVWRALCQVRFGVVAKPVTVHSWHAWYQVVKNPKKHESITAESPNSPNELLAVLRSQGERIAQMDQQYAAALGTIRQMCDERARSTERAQRQHSPEMHEGTPRVLRQKSPRPQEEEHDGIGVTSDGDVLYAEERATFVDASFDEDFVVRRLSSSPTATAVLSPYRELREGDSNKTPSPPPHPPPPAQQEKQLSPEPAIPPVLRAGSPIASTHVSRTPRLLQPPDVTPPPFARVQPCGRYQQTADEVQEALRQKAEEEKRKKALQEYEQERMKAHHQHVEKQRWYQEGHLDGDDDVDPLAENKESDAPVLQYESPYSLEYCLELAADQEEAVRFMSTASSNEEISEFLVANLQRRLWAEQDRISTQLGKGIQHLFAENKNLRSMYQHAQEEAKMISKKLKAEIVKSRKAKSTHIAVVSRFEETKKCVKKLKTYIQKSKNQTLPLHNEIATIKMEKEEVEELRHQVLEQRDCLWGDLQATSSKVVALETMLHDMQKRHEENIKEALTANCTVQSNAPLESENATLRINLEGLQQVLLHSYLTNQKMREKYCAATKANEEYRMRLQESESAYQTLLEEHQHERTQWYQYEENYKRQITLLKQNIATFRQQTHKIPQQVPQP